MKWLKEIHSKMWFKKPRDFEKKVIFIVGLYKSGTSWLSLALGKHPEAMALPELDVIRAFAREGSVELIAKTLEERVQYILSASNYGRLPVAITERAREVPVARMFDYFEQNASNRVLLKRDLTSQQFNRAKSAALSGNGCSIETFLNYWALDKISAEKLFGDAIGVENPKKAIRAFCRIHQLFSGGFLVLKSADQINHIKHLKRVMPNSPTVLIVRDGRDMAISATKFEQYVNQKTHFGDIWKVVEHDFFTRLEQWCHVVRQINALEKSDNLFVLRYEDLSDDFEATFTQLLFWAGMDTSPSIVSRIKKETSFEKMSGGREKGDEDISSNIRKGITGEWRVLLSEQDKVKAWELASNELALFGYGPR